MGCWGARRETAEMLPPRRCNAPRLLFPDESGTHQPTNQSSTRDHGGSLKRHNGGMTGPLRSAPAVTLQVPGIISVSPNLTASEAEDTKKSPLSFDACLYEILEAGRSSRESPA